MCIYLSPRSVMASWLSYCTSNQQVPSLSHTFSKGSSGLVLENRGCQFYSRESMGHDISALVRGTEPLSAP